MTRDDLIVSAGRLRQPEPASTEEFMAKSEKLAGELNRLMMDRPDLVRLIGKDNELMMQDNSRNFTRFMGSLFLGFRPEILVDTALWVFRAYRAHGFQTTYWPANLDTYVQVLRSELSAGAFDEVYPFMEWLIVNVPVFVALSDEALADNGD